MKFILKASMLRTTALLHFKSRSTLPCWNQIHLEIMLSNFPHCFSGPWLDSACKIRENQEDLLIHSLLHFSSSLANSLEVILIKYAKREFYGNWNHKVKPLRNMLWHTKAAPLEWLDYWLSFLLILNRGGKSQLISALMLKESPARNQKINSFTETGFNDSFKKILKIH